MSVGFRCEIKTAQPREHRTPLLRNDSISESPKISQAERLRVSDLKFRWETILTTTRNCKSEFWVARMTTYIPRKSKNKSNTPNMPDSSTFLRTSCNLHRNLWSRHYYQPLLTEKTTGALRGWGIYQEAPVFKHYFIGFWNQKLLHRECMEIIFPYVSVLIRKKGGFKR